MSYPDIRDFLDVSVLLPYAESMRPSDLILMIDFVISLSFSAVIVSYTKSPSETAASFTVPAFE